MSVGEDGYLQSCTAIVGTAKKMAERIGSSPVLAAELEILGRPLVSVVAFRATTLNIYSIADAMTARGWHLNALQNPPAIHIAFTLPIVKVWERLAADLEATIEAEREKERVRAVEGKGAAAADAAGDTACCTASPAACPTRASWSTWPAASSI